MKIKQGYILREVAGNYIVVAVGEAVKNFNGIINLNETGAFLWRQLQEGATEEQLKVAMLEEYDVQEDVAQNDIKAFIDKLNEKGLLD